MNPSKSSKVSPTLAINQMMIKRKKQGLPCYKFGFGQSPFSVPQIMVDELGHHVREKDYLPSGGLEPLREQIAGFYTSKYNTTFSIDQVIIGPGSKELLFLTQLLLERDLIIPAPSWVSYAPQAQYLGHKVHWVSTSQANDYKLMADDLEAKLSQLDSKTIMILNSPNNPTGHVYSHQELEEISIVARKYGLLIIADEIYSEFTFYEDYPSMTAHYPEGTIVSSGLSKSHGAGGWRLGWMVYPKALSQVMTQLVALASETYSCVSSPIQYAALKAFGDREIKDYLGKCNHVLKCVSQYINNHLSGNISAIPSQGGFYTMVTCDVDHGDCDSFWQSLLNQTGVAVLSGTAFGMPANSITARLAYIDFDGAAALNDTDLFHWDENLGSFHFAQLKQGIGLLEEWVNQ